ncbi:CASP8-associated protein 2 [Merluccius polli]|uniref:CASP8-associated protein 2 n=1 Tax=Merluccius polli TaxID=89951 RepID=A0AA47NRZ9_MERPO|nr:CASP8-associated protein 2 [Merluccius polli]
MKLNQNKEKKHPDNPLAQDPQPVTVTALPIHSDGVSASSCELEDGEILSDGNEATADISPPKRSKLTRPANNNNKPSPKSTSQTAERSSEERRLSSKGTSKTLSPSTTSPSCGKSRFKKVCLVEEQTPFITMKEVMETLERVRFQIRKKYMKLHKVFPKKSFYAMMDHFQQSFSGFVDSANFGEISAQVGELKTKLRKLVMSVFNKVKNNGIVNRIFDLQATNLKQRLWEFVDVQLNYLFLDIQIALKTFCKPTVTHNAEKTEQKVVSTGRNRKIFKKLPVNTSPKKSRSPKEKRPVQTIQRRIKPSPVVPSKTGLGRGKDIRIICMERQNSDPEPPGPGLLPVPLTPEKGHRTSLLISHNSSIQDRSDFEILTEQQASSLTFNLVRDTQMGEIFKCLMQGSDLLDASVAAGDATSWSLSTPRKECLPGDSLLSITSPSKFLSPSKFTSPGKFVTPTKFVTSPSKLITTWSSISPSKLCSPQPKVLHMPLNPAMFDESCLLELPSSSRGATQRSYSLLAEDLAVSLTIPSPLKSDSHLSFLQPRTMDMMSTPESVISAHFGEDALLDGEDAWEQQDLHLALDTDNSNSSCCSSTTSTITTAGDASTPVLFQFKPHLPMQAVVMERSNDHFIVKIRQSAVEAADATLTADDSLSRTLTEEDQYQGETKADMLEPHTTKRVPKALFLEKSFGKEPSPPKPSPPPPPPSPPEETIPAAPESPQAKTKMKTKASVKEPPPPPPPPPRPSESASSMDEMEISTASEGRLAIVEDASSSGTPAKEAMDKVCRKRKRRHEETKAKRAKKNEERGGGKKRKKAAAAAAASPKHREPRSSKRREESEGKKSPPKTPPSSLSAKNVVKKKGEVVVAWTRDEDRSILLDLKTRGASRETFSVLSEKLNKTSAQIAERFAQLMKLFKKQGKLDSSCP